MTSREGGGVGELVRLDPPLLWVWSKAGQIFILGPFFGCKCFYPCFFGCPRNPPTRPGWVPAAPLWVLKGSLPPNVKATQIVIPAAAMIPFVY